MNPEAQRIAICELLGFVGCTDADCDYRAAQHLHKGGAVYFPEPYSMPRYPDPPNDLNAMHEAEGKLIRAQHMEYIENLNEATRHIRHATIFPMIHATATQRAGALLRSIGKWDDKL